MSSEAGWVFGDRDYDAGAFSDLGLVMTEPFEVECDAGHHRHRQSITFDNKGMIRLSPNITREKRREVRTVARA